MCGRHPVGKDFLFCRAELVGSAPEWQSGIGTIEIEHNRLRSRMPELGPTALSQWSH